jgi:hypothetical protein
MCLASRVSGCVGQEVSETGHADGQYSVMALTNGKTEATKKC